MRCASRRRRIAATPSALSAGECASRRRSRGRSCRARRPTSSRRRHRERRMPPTACRQGTSRIRTRSGPPGPADGPARRLRERRRAAAREIHFRRRRRPVCPARADSGPSVRRANRETRCACRRATSAEWRPVRVRGSAAEERRRMRSPQHWLVPFASTMTNASRRPSGDQATDDAVQPVHVGTRTVWSGAPTLPTWMASSL